jgi:hypothetical protein
LALAHPVDAGVPRPQFRSATLDRRKPDLHWWPTTSGYARQLKVWVHDPEVAAWEYCTVLGDLDTPDGRPRDASI